MTLLIVALSFAIWCHGIWPSLKLIGYCQFSTKPLPEPMLTYCHFGSKKQTSSEIEIQM